VGISDINVCSIFWFLLVVLVLYLLITPGIARSRQVTARQALIQRIEQRRGSRVIVMIHRQEGASILGVPLARYIDIEDSEAVLRAIRMTDPDVPIDLIVHTPGGLVLAAMQIAAALVRHKAPVTVMVPHYAMSGGTLLALASDQVLMDPNAVLGPVDPQLGQYPAAGILEVLERKGPNYVSDDTIIMARMADKALRQVRSAVTRLLTMNGMEEQRARDLAELLSSGHWTHDYPIVYEEAQRLGLPVSDELPIEVHQLMDLYPQPTRQAGSVQYISAPRQSQDS
jgi:ClpP class serine protease